MSSISEFELGQTLGNIDGHLKSIDGKLKKGDETMQDLQESITEGFKEQKEEIHAIDKELGEHKQKGHYCHLANSDAKRHGWREHAPTVAKGSAIGAVIGGIIFGILKSVGWL